MKLFRFIPILLFLSLYNSTSYAVDCSSIKMDSSVNIIKKIKCKAQARSSGTETSTTTKETTGEKKEGWKLWKKPEWMKKKN